MRAQVDLKTFDGGRRGTKRSEPAWRKLRLRPPPPGGEEPTFGRPAAKLRRLCDGASSTVSGEAEDEDGFQSDSEQYVRAVPSPLPWEGPAGGDARLRRLVPPLQRAGATPRPTSKAPPQAPPPPAPPPPAPLPRLASPLPAPCPPAARATPSRGPCLPLCQVGPSLSDHAFGLVATHLPGRTGAECASRWALLRGAPAARSKSAK